MNWPPLSSETSKELARIIQEAVQQKPKNLLEHVAAELQAASGWDTASYEKRFEECKRIPRKYVLEDRCPSGQNPFVWVPMRYSDETILEQLRREARDFSAAVLGCVPVSREALLNHARVAYPELAYFPEGSEGQRRADSALLAVYLTLTGAAVDTARDHPEMDGPLLLWARERLQQGLQKSGELLDALVICALLGLLEYSEGFCAAYGEGGVVASEAVLRALRRSPGALPSFRRLPSHLQTLAEAVRSTSLPFEDFLAAEAIPAHLASVKENLGPLESGVTFLLCSLAIERVVAAAVAPPGQGSRVELVKLGAQAVAAVEKYSAQKAYELFLKKRAEQVEWRLIRDNALQRAVVRVCCMAGLETKEEWDEVEAAMKHLSETEREVFQREVGQKDGTPGGPAAEKGPTFVLAGASLYLRRARLNPFAEALFPGPALKVLVRILEEATRSYASSKERVLRLSLYALASFAEKYTGNGATSFEDVFFLLEETPAGIAVRVTG